MKVKTETPEEKGALGMIDNKRMSLVELQDKIHAQNKEMGWWDEPRPFSTFVCLFHSELSEAMEGDRKDLVDDHLPQYPMFQVEIADFVIRCLDWLGSYENDDLDDIGTLILPSSNNCDNIAELHHLVSLSFNCTVTDDRVGFIKDAVAFSFEVSRYCEFDLYKIILEKVEYNKHRADHKRENRKKEGGKKY